MPRAKCGILSKGSRKTTLCRCKGLLGVAQDRGSEKQVRLGWQELLFNLTGIEPTVCPHCGKGKMVLKEALVPKMAPPMTNGISSQATEPKGSLPGQK